MCCTMEKDWCMVVKNIGNIMDRKLDLIICRRMLTNVGIVLDVLGKKHSSNKCTAYIYIVIQI